MKIGIDLSMLSANNTGIDNYALETTLELIKNPGEYYLFSNNRFFEKFFKESSNVHLIILEQTRPNFVWILRVIFYLYKNNFDVFYSVSNFMFGILYSRTIQIIHDLAPIKRPQDFPKKAEVMFKLQLWLVYKFCWKIGTISNTTYDDLVSTYGPRKNMFYVGVGLNRWALELTSLEKQEEIKQKYNLPDEFILSVGTLQPRKNHINMIKAFKLFKESMGKDIKFVITGKKGWFYDSIFEEVRKQKLEDSVIFTGYVPDEDVKHIFDLCKLFFYMSFWEGAGLPPLEAYARKKNSVISKIKVFEEIMGNKAYYADPNDSSNIADMLMKGYNENRNIDNKIFLEEYLWKNVSDRLFGLIH